ncbi:MAG: hypothetical protein FJ290_06815 [Planctomycetes bacterium]|nr:hypothetical protein [Planctomycetota bacterium]
METEKRPAHWLSPFKKGFISCFAICSAIAGVAVYLNNQILALKDEKIDRLEKELSRKDDCAEDYHKEQVLRKQFELKAVQLQESLDGHLAHKWEEKYESEKLNRQALQEKLNLLDVRAEDLKKALESRQQPDPTKDAEIKFLKEQLQIAKAETDQLRTLYTKAKEREPSPGSSQQAEHKRDAEMKSLKEDLQVAKAEADQLRALYAKAKGPEPSPPKPHLPIHTTNEGVYKMVLAAIPGLHSSDKSKVIISAYRDTSFTITVTQLAGVVRGMFSSDIVSTIKGIAPNIRNDGNVDSVDRIAKQCFSSDAQTVMAILVRAEKADQQK